MASTSSDHWSSHVINCQWDVAARRTLYGFGAAAVVVDHHALDGLGLGAAAVVVYA